MAPRPEALRETSPKSSLKQRASLGRSWGAPRQRAVLLAPPPFLGDPQITPPLCGACAGGWGSWVKGHRDQRVRQPVAFAGPGRGSAGPAIGVLPSWGAPLSLPSQAPPAFSHQTLQYRPLLHVPEGFLEGRSFCPQGFHWPLWGRSNVDTVQPSRPTLQPTPLLHLQPTASSSPVSPDSGPVETSVFGQSRFRPAGTFCAPGEGQGRALCVPCGGTDSLKFHFPPSSSPAGSGNAHPLQPWRLRPSQGTFQHHRPPLTTSKQTLNPTPAARPLRLKWLANHRDSVSSWQTSTKLKTERRDPPPLMGGNWPFVTGWNFLLSGMSP